MIRSGNFLSSFVLSFIFGALVVPPVVSSVSAEDIYGGTAQRMGGRCARLGEGFVDLGDGICGRVSRHVRVGSDTAVMNGWTGGGTTNAAMQSGGLTMVPGAEVTQRLRVRGDLDTASPFR